MSEENKHHVHKEDVILYLGGRNGHTSSPNTAKAIKKMIDYVPYSLPARTNKNYPQCSEGFFHVHTDECFPP